MKVCLIYRKKNPIFFSIEKVFDLILPFLVVKYQIQKLVVPFYTNGILSIFRNLFFIRARGADIFHITGDIHYMALALPRSKTVLTIHDCNFIHQTAGVKKRVIKWLFLDMPVKRAGIITTISEKSRQEIIKYSNCDPAKIVVIPNPLNDHINYLPKKFNTECPNILFIGSTPNKNLERVIEALKSISCKLIIIGKIDANQQYLLSNSGITYMSMHGLSDQEMIDQYAACDMLLFPSTYEGFGLPIVEAQKAGRPIVTSDLDPMREVAGGAACLVDPFSIQSIKEGVLKIISDKNYRKQLLDAGFQNIEKFDAKLIAQQYLSCYKKLL